MAKNKILLYEEVMQVLDGELKWCTENPNDAFGTEEYRNGFQNGLIQAKYLVEQLVKGPSPLEKVAKGFKAVQEVSKGYMEYFGLKE